MYRKLLNTAKKRPMSVSVLAICAVTALILFLRSDAFFLIMPARLRGLSWGRVVPPLPSSVPRLPADDTDPASQHDPVLSHIKMMCGTIEFVQRHQHFVYSEDGDSFTVEEHVYTSVEVPDTVRGIAGLDDGWSYQDRMRAVHSLPDNLSVKEQTALLHFLHKKHSDDNLSLIELNAVKNDVATHIMKQIPANPEFPLHLIAIFHNRLLDSMIRDYAIQFLGQSYQQIGTPEHRQAARETLFSALADTAHIAAPAIIAIDGLAEFPGFPRRRIADEAFKLAADTLAADSVRVPALQIAAKRKHPEAIPLAIAILTNAEPQHYSSSSSPSPQNSSTSPIMLKMSAIAAIGSYGSPGHADVVMPFRNSPDIRLRTAAKAALKKLQKTDAASAKNPAHNFRTLELQNFRTS